MMLGRTETVHFEEVRIKATKRWKDSRGRRRQLTKVFSATVNPFNKDKATGLPKTRKQVWDDLWAKRLAWDKEPPPAEEA